MLAPLPITLLLLAPGDVFEPPFRVRDGAEPIDVEGGHAAPFYADVDGVPDLLVGQFDQGRLRVYRNRGSAREPRFEGFTWFATGEQEGRIPAG